MFNKKSDTTFPNFRVLTLSGVRVWENPNLLFGLKKRPEKVEKKVIPDGLENPHILVQSKGIA